MNTDDVQFKQAEDYNKKFLSEVVPGLWLGSIDALKEIKKITRSWTVISVLQTSQAKAYAKECLYEDKFSRIENHVEWELPDQQQANFLSNRLNDILQIIDLSITTSSQTSCSRACLVHCAGGISRSASVVAAWLLSRRRCHSLEEALKVLRYARPKVSPNPGFLNMLRGVEQCNGDIIAAKEWMKNKAAAITEIDSTR